MKFTNYKMFWTLLVLACLSMSVVRPHPTSCAEDSQCSSGFYCQASSHLCIECLRCELLKREARLPSDVCVQSVTECGVCFKGLVQVDDGDGYAQCIPAVPESSGAVLPPYGWASIAVSLVLMVVILCLFAKMKTFKVAYAARTSVQSLHTVPLAGIPCAPPPPYNDHQNSSPSSQPGSLEMRKLLETPHPRESPSPEMRPRENSNSQNARVFNSPVYVRSPQNGTRYSSPESAVIGPRSDVLSAASIAAEPTWTVDTVPNNNANTTNKIVDSKGHGKVSSSPRKTRAEHEFQDTNNNFSASQEASASQGSNSNATAYCNGVVAGPSFIINVVENINNATVTHAEYHT